MPLPYTCHCEQHAKDKKITAKTKGYLRTAFLIGADGEYGTEKSVAERRPCKKRQIKANEISMLMCRKKQTALPRIAARPSMREV
ncbi:hypothetical protein [Litchfieldella qijiaojingensis]|uniref:hypothetical protein n=1 Tax=Litchfieldella qijiaojingensis TaxID=980347 RepID=UPI001674DB67|nr:hypothetical protein [Halomonas qijiaojingensis]